MIYIYIFLAESTLLSHQQAWIGKALITMNERVKTLMKMIKEGQEREGLL